MKKILLLILFCLFSIILSGCQKKAPAPKGKNAAKTVIKVGYFPNITHSQALIGLSNGQFQKVLGDQVAIESKTFNAGPSLVWLK